LVVKFFGSLTVVVLLVLGAVPAAAQTATQTAVIDEAAAALKRDPVFVHPAADTGRAGQVDADRVREAIEKSGEPVFVAILPAEAASEAGGNPAQVPAVLGERTGLTGTYAVVTGSSFRAASNALPRGRAGALATAAFQAKRDDGVTAVLVEFVTRVDAAAAGGGGGSGNDSGGGDSGGDEGGSAVPLLVLGGLGVGGYALYRRKKRQREEQELAGVKASLRAELQALSEEIIRLDPEVRVKPEAADEYEEGVVRFRAAEAALDQIQTEADAARVHRALLEGHYAMARARAMA
jgi:hypothetical protein